MITEAAPQDKHVLVDPDLHYLARVEAAKRGLTIKELVELALTKELNQE